MLGINAPELHYYCADVSTGKLYQPQHYYKVLPESRLFFYAMDLVGALKMNFQLVT